MTDIDKLHDKLTNDTSSFKEGMERAKKQLEDFELDKEELEKRAEELIEEKRAAEVLAERTGRPIEEFLADDYEIPESLDDLERVPEDEWKDD